MNPQEFLVAMAETANKHDFAAHMNLISKDVKVYGVPNFEVINYDDWYNQCKKEFENMLLLRVGYQGLQVLVEAPDRIKFIAVEMTEATDGHKNIYCIEFIIQKEDDGQWRVVEERILPEDVQGSDHQNGALQ